MHTSHAAEMRNPGYRIRRVIDMNRLYIFFSVTAVALIASMLVGPVGGEPRTASAEPTETEVLTANLRNHVTPLRTLQDLSALQALLADRRAVLLGDATHGTQEFYDWRIALSKRLIETGAFRFLAVEGDWGPGVLVNRYVLHQEGAPPSALAALQTYTGWPAWLWANETVLELVEWLRGFNARLPMERRVGFYGIDLYGMQDAMEAVPRYLQMFDGDATHEARQAYRCLRKYGNDTERYVRNVLSAHSCAEPVQVPLQRLREHRDEWRAADPEAYFHAEQNALAVRNAERYYRAKGNPDTPSWNVRSHHMYQTFEHLLHHYGENARGIFWAHNSHIGDARATSMAQDGLISVGQLARESLGAERVALVGSSTYRGRAIAVNNAGDVPQIMHVPPARRGSVADLLMQTSTQPFLLVMDPVRHLQGLREAMDQRAVGVVYDPRQEQGNYVPTVLPERYDALVFFPVTHALR